MTQREPAHRAHKTKSTRRTRCSFATNEVHACPHVLLRVRVSPLCMIFVPHVKDGLRLATEGLRTDRILRAVLCSRASHPAANNRTHPPALATPAISQSFPPAVVVERQQKCIPERVRICLRGHRSCPPFARGPLAGHAALGATRRGRPSMEKAIKNLSPFMDSIHRASGPRRSTSTRGLPLRCAEAARSIGLVVFGRASRESVRGKVYFRSSW